MQRILIIKLGALGDIVQAVGAFSAIRKHHPKAHITVLTRPLYHDLIANMGFFDEIWLDERPKLTQIRKWLKQRSRLQSGNFDRVYDLQGVTRTNLYFWSLTKRPEWVGMARGCSHPYPQKNPHRQHPQERFKTQLGLVGIQSLPAIDLSFLVSETDQFDVHSPYALLVPGASNAHGGQKRWPLQKYTEIACYLKSKNILPVIIGGAKEDNALIDHHCEGALDLTGKTSFIDIVSLAKNASFAIGNDTGPVLLCHAAGCKTLTLFSSVNPPSLGGARGVGAEQLFCDDLNQLSVQTVMSAVEKLSNYPLDM